jgi:hypothetical protein
MRGWSPDRLGGWLTAYYGSFTLAYEVNSQESSKHLDIRQSQELGGLLILSTSAFLKSSNAGLAIREVDERRQQRLSCWARHVDIPVSSDAIESEAIMCDSGSAMMKTTSTENLMH